MHKLRTKLAGHICQPNSQAEITKKLAGIETRRDKLNKTRRTSFGTKLAGISLEPNSQASAWNQTRRHQLLDQTRIKSAFYQTRIKSKKLKLAWIFINQTRMEP